MTRILCYIVAYNAQAHLAKLLADIPAELWQDPRFTLDIRLSDDSSSDDTYAFAQQLAAAFPHPMSVTRTPRNLGYGGNQKLGYQYTIDEGYDSVVLLHGDGQYAPGQMLKLLEPVLAGQADVVIGSRMMNKLGALRGGMPLYKFIANILLTQIQNFIIGHRLSEFHSGYRVYSAAALKAVPFQRNSDGFDFDTDILIQLIGTGQRIREIAIPTFYGNEICYVNGPKYAFDILRSTLLARLCRHGLAQSAKFTYK